MKLENIKGIVWDLDGTLIDSFSIFEQIIAEVVKDSGHTMPSREYMLLNYHGSLEETVQKLLGVNSVEELDTIITSFLEKQEHHYAGDLEEHLFKDASMLAQSAAKQGIHQLLVTNRAHEGRGRASPRHIIAATVLADSIHEVNAGDEVDFRKPDSRSMGNWMEKYHLSPDEVVVIGDQFVDAQLAINVGARSILIKRNGDIPYLDTLNSQNIYVVDNLESIELVK